MNSLKTNRITTVKMTVNLITFLFALLFTALAPAVPLFTTTAINPDPAIITSSTNFPSGDLNIGMACTEHELKCLAAKDNGKGGGVFECLNGAWKLRVQCSDSERCVGGVVPHCQWK